MVICSCRLFCVLNNRQSKKPDGDKPVESLDQTWMGLPVQTWLWLYQRRSTPWNWFDSSRAFRLSMWTAKPTMIGRRLDVLRPITGSLSVVSWVELWLRLMVVRRQSAGEKKPAAPCGPPGFLYRKAVTFCRMWLSWLCDAETWPLYLVCTRCWHPTMPGLGLAAHESKMVWAAFVRWL